MHRPVRCFLLPTVLLFFSQGVSGAQTLYGLTFDSGPGSTPQLITIDTSTGVGTLVTPVAAPLSDMNPFGIAFRGANLYAWDQNKQMVRELNPATGTEIAANALGLGICGSVVIGEGDIAFDKNGFGYLSPVQGFFNRLVRFDLGLAPLTPNSTSKTMSPGMDGLAFNSAGKLFGLRAGGGTELYLIDPNTSPTTALTSLIGSTGISLPSATRAGLAFDASDNLFAAVGSSTKSFLYKIDTVTGKATLVNPNPNVDIGFKNVCGLSFKPAGPVPAFPAGPGVKLTKSSVNVAEGGATDTYDIVLNTIPAANVTISIVADSQVTVSPSTLTFAST